jgi:hypothetical protein
MILSTIGDSGVPLPTSIQPRRAYSEATREPTSEDTGVGRNRSAASLSPGRHPRSVRPTFESLLAGAYSLCPTDPERVCEAAIAPDSTHVGHPRTRSSARPPISGTQLTRPIMILMLPVCVDPSPCRHAERTGVSAAAAQVAPLGSCPEPLPLTHSVSLGPNAPSATAALRTATSAPCCVSLLHVHRRPAR